jgi:hypothetical protein
MGASFYSQDPGIMNAQLQNQQLLIRFQDTQFYTASGSTVTVNLVENIGAITLANLHADASGTVVKIQAANISITANASPPPTNGNTVVLTLPQAFTTNDVLVLNYIINQYNVAPYIVEG